MTVIYNYYLITIAVTRIINTYIGIYLSSKERPGGGGSRAQVVDGFLGVGILRTLEGLLGKQLRQEAAGVAAADLRKRVGDGAGARLLSGAGRQEREDIVG